jgi:hypothetical protein
MVNGDARNPLVLYARKLSGILQESSLVLGSKMGLTGVAFHRRESCKGV